MITRPFITTLHSLLFCTIIPIASHAQELPANAKTLKKSFDQAMERATSPLVTKYLLELDKLKQQAAKVSDTDAVAALTNEIDRVNATSPKSGNDAEEIKTKLTQATWVGTSSGLYQWIVAFDPSGTLKLTKPDGTSGWLGWGWQVNDQNELLISVTGGELKKVKLSKRIDQITFEWGNWGTLVKQR